jgi:hypothetical protein
MESFFWCTPADGLCRHGSIQTVLDVQDIFEQLLGHAEADTLDATTALLNNHFTPQRNTTYNRLLFRKEKQKDGETVAQFATRLRQLTQYCNFPAAQLDTYILDQIIDSCKSESLRVKLLAEVNLTLQRALEIAQARESPADVRDLRASKSKRETDPN